MTVDARVDDPVTERRGEANADHEARVVDRLEHGGRLVYVGAGNAKLRARARRAVEQA